MNVLQRKIEKLRKSGSIFNFPEELFFFLHQGGGRLRDSGGVSCPCPINTGPPGSAAGIQAARAQEICEAGETQLHGRCR